MASQDAFLSSMANWLTILTFLYVIVSSIAIYIHSLKNSREEMFSLMRMIMHSRSEILQHEFFFKMISQKADSAETQELVDDMGQSLENARRLCEEVQQIVQLDQLLNSKRELVSRTRFPLKQRSFIWKNEEKTRAMDRLRLAKIR